MGRLVYFPSSRGSEGLGGLPTHMSEFGGAYTDVISCSFSADLCSLTLSCVSPVTVPVDFFQDIFDFLGLSYREPWQREVDASWLQETATAAEEASASTAARRKDVVSPRFGLQSTAMVLI